MGLCSSFVQIPICILFHFGFFINSKRRVVRINSIKNKFCVSFLKFCTIFRGVTRRGRGASEVNVKFLPIQPSLTFHSDPVTWFTTNRSSISEKCFFPNFGSEKTFFSHSSFSLEILFAFFISFGRSGMRNTSYSARQTSFYYSQVFSLSQNVKCKMRFVPKFIVNIFCDRNHSAPKIV